MYSGGFMSDITDNKPAWYAAINGMQYAKYPANNYGEMSPHSTHTDILKLEENVRNYLKKLDGMQLTIPISDIACDLKMTEECVIKILEKYSVVLDVLDE